LSGVGDEKDLEVSLDGEVIMGGISESEEQSAMVGWFSFVISNFYHSTFFLFFVCISPNKFYPLILYFFRKLY
jgi:hypothetical protein